MTPRILPIRRPGARQYDGYFALGPNLPSRAIMFRPHVGYPTQNRTPKASFGWYRDFIAAQRRSGQLTAAPSR